MIYKNSDLIKNIFDEFKIELDFVISKNLKVSMMIKKKIVDALKQGDDQLRDKIVDFLMEKF